VGKDSQYGKAYEWLVSQGQDPPLVGKIARDSTTVRLALENIIWEPSTMTISDPQGSAVYCLDALTVGPSKISSFVDGSVIDNLLPYRFQRVGAYIVIPGGWHTIGPTAGSASAAAPNVANPLRLRDTAIGTFEYSGPTCIIPDNTAALLLRMWSGNQFGPDIVLRIETSNSQLYYSGGGYPPLQPE
jgi:hypothetical protein